MDSCNDTFENAEVLNEREGVFLSSGSVVLCATWAGGLERLLTA